MMKLRVLLIGEQSAGIQTLRMLANTAHTVVAVMTTEPPTDAHNGVSSLWRVAQGVRIYHLAGATDQDACVHKAYRERRD